MQAQPGEAGAGQGKTARFAGLALAAALAAAGAGCSAPGGRSAADPRARPSADAVARVELATPALAQPTTPTVAPPPRVVISELLTDPLLRDEGVGDYVELANLATASLRLADLALWLPSGKRVALERPQLPWLRPGEIALVRGAALPGPEDRTTIRAKGLRLANAAGRVELWWRDARVDVAQWQRRRPWPKSRAGVALERVSPQSDGSGPRAWRSAQQVLDGLERGSPGRVAWACSSVAGTALAGRCVADRPPPSRRGCAR